MTTDLSTRPSNELSNTGPTGLGNESMSASDLSLARLRLLQAMSQAAVDGKGKPGTYMNSLTEEAYGTDVAFLPVRHFKNRVLLRMGEGLKCRSLDMVHGIGDPGVACDTCSYKDWPKERLARGEQVPERLTSPECTVSHNWLGFVLGVFDAKENLKASDEPDMVILQWRSTATEAAKRLSTLYFQARIVRPVEWYDRVYRLGVERKQNDRGTFFVPTVRLQGKATPEHVEWATNLLAAFGERPLDVTDDIVHEETVRVAEVAAAAENEDF